MSAGFWLCLFIINMDIIINNAKMCRFKYKNCECFLEYANVKDDVVVYKCFCCNRNYQEKPEENFNK